MKFSCQHQAFLCELKIFMNSDKRGLSYFRIKKITSWNLLIWDMFYREDFVHKNWWYLVFLG